MDALGFTPLGAAIEGGLGLLQSGYGLYQTVKGNNDLKKAQASRPTYTIPEEIRTKMTNAQLMALEGLPAAQKEQYINNLQRTANFGLNALADRKAGIAGVSNLVQNLDDGYNNLLVQDSAARRDNQKYLGQVQSEMGGYKDKAFEVNQMNPYLQNYQDAKTQKLAGIQNVWGGLGEMATGFGSLFGMNERKPTKIPINKGISAYGVPGNEDLNTGMYGLNNIG